VLAGRLDARDSGKPSTRATSGTPQRDGGLADPVDADEPTERPADLLDARREEWESTAERLSNNERAVYEAVLDADGVLPQSDVVDRTDISKASVSRALDGLEARDLVERKRRGMGNVVVLQ
jgi:uncharacterized membrane protein